MTDVDVTPQQTTTSLTGIRLALHLEGLAALVASVALYAEFGQSWLLFVLLLFAPDLAFIPYMLNAELGRKIYNFVHWYTLPLLLGTAAVLTDWSLGIALALIWSAHISLDRTIGYGLKYPGDFKDTHLQHV